MSPLTCPHGCAWLTDCEACNAEAALDRPTVRFVSGCVLFLVVLGLGAVL